MTKLASTWGARSVQAFWISSAVCPAAASSAPWSTSRPWPVERFRESTTYTWPMSAAAMQAFW